MKLPNRRLNFGIKQAGLTEALTIDSGQYTISLFLIKRSNPETVVSFRVRLKQPSRLTLNKPYDFSKSITSSKCERTRNFISKSS